MLGIVLVVYKSFEDTVSFVKHELPKIGCPNKAVIVDVAAALASTQRLAAACGGVLVAADAESVGEGGPFVLHAAANLGYAKGNNLGARFLLRHFPGMQWLLFSNTDVELLTPRLTEALIAVLQDRADVACVGPKVLSPDGTEQLPFDKPIPIGTAMWHNVAFPFLRGRPPWETAYKLRPGTSVGQYCYWVSGCFLMSRAADFVAAGMFDEETFLYGEEVILSERLRPRERHFYYEPSLEIRHHCGKTISRYLQNPALARIDLASSLHYYRTYRRANAALILLFRCCGAIRLLWVRLAYARYERRRARALRAEEARSAP